MQDFDNEAKLTSKMKIPRCTYRFQFRSGFTFKHALNLIPYLAELGISHVYASPLLLAMFGSTHGYDVFDFSQIDPDLGTEADFEEFVKALHESNMGLVQDIVPNHMGIGGTQNRWWWDVLKNGRTSQYADYFDIDWNSPDPRLHNKILMPLLGDRYEHTLAKGEIRLDVADNELVVRYYDHILPVNPDFTQFYKNTDLHIINSNPEALDEILQQQHYRLTIWKHGSTELNYRRFFNVITLVGVRVEDQNVFDDAHIPIAKWAALGLLDGLRVDHPDGLRDPEQYLRRLHDIAPDAWIVVEKILEPGEDLPINWPVAGTTGYDFMTRVGGLFIDPNGEKPLTDYYVTFTQEPIDYAAIIREKKRFILREMLCAEVSRLIDLLIPITARHWRYRDFNQNELKEALIELIACFPVYRTYGRDETGYLSEADITCIQHAVTTAKTQRPDLGTEPFEFLTSLLLWNLSGELEQDFVMRFGQLTGPAMAKGVEDTTFYCYNRFISLNEVGGDPSHFSVSVEAFHQACIKALTHWPNSMLSSSTHDTKRSEDVRARLALLSEIPHQWVQTVQRWARQNEKYRYQGWPDRNIEYFYYQTLVGAWPLSLERVLNYIDKAACESKQYTSWAERNTEYDEALRSFIKVTLSDPEFIADLEDFLAPLIHPGYINSLAQTLLKLTTPGVPDIYQGTELWDFSLVDPDNRRSVDFALRQTMLNQFKSLSLEEICRRYEEGFPKLWLIRQTLTLRAKHPEIFSQGCYEPLNAKGSKAKHIVAFNRGSSVVTIVPRLILGLKSTSGYNNWADTTLNLPPNQWRNQLTDEVFQGDTLPVSDLLKSFPVALLVKD